MIEIGFFGAVVVIEMGALVVDENILEDGVLLFVDINT